MAKPSLPHRFDHLSAAERNLLRAIQEGRYPSVEETLYVMETASRLRGAAKRVLEADMLGVRDTDALNALERAAGFCQQGGA